ncbi:MAG: uroporphyrinogen-III synthase [Actinomycetota bacterium]|nr:uroporphyrinogen-III synthase [Actinomycetota bacterium]
MPLRPLEGFVVGITADRRWEEQAELLRRRGATVVHGPSISTLYLASDANLKQATLDVIARPPDYLVATTGIGMRAWLEAAAAWGLGDRLVEVLGGARIVARGPKAAAAVQAGGLPVWDRSATEKLGGVTEILLAEPLAGCLVAVQEYGMKSPELRAVLDGAGATVVEVPVYRWRVPVDTKPAIRLVEAICDRRIDAVTFTSAPAVHNLFQIAADIDAGEELRRAINDGTLAVCVGPVCAEGATIEGITNPIAPDIGRMGLLVRALSEHLQARRRPYQVAGSELVVPGSMVEVDGVVGELTAKERAVFELLAASPGAVVSRPTILTRVWGSPGADPHALESTVGRLRRRLGPCGIAVRTCRRRGYQLDSTALEPASS